MLHTNQRGFSKVVLLAIIAGALVVGGGAYYLLTKDKDNSDSSVNTNLTADSACSQYLDDDDFCKYASNVAVKRNYKVTATTTTNEASTSTMIIETDDKGNNSSKITTGDNVIQSVTFNNTYYMLDTSDNTWIKYPTAQTNPLEETEIDFDFAEEESKPAESRIQYKSLGKEACGDLTCFKYQMVDPSSSDSEILIWFDDQDYLTRKMTTKTTEGTMEMIYSYEPINITEPSPVKDLGTNDELSQEQIQEMVERYAQ